MNSGLSDAYRQGEQSAQMRIMDNSLVRLQDRVHELEAALRKLESSVAIERHRAIQDIWTKIQDVKQEINVVQLELTGRMAGKASDEDLLEFKRAYIHPLTEKVEQLDAFKMRVAGAVLALATVLGALSSYLVELLFKKGG